MSSFIIIIGCGAAKGTKPAQALKLYNGPLFRARMEYAAARYGCEPHYVLSGLHGLVKADKVIPPYESAPKDKRVADWQAWNHKVRNQVYALGTAADIVVLASGKYIGWSKYLANVTRPEPSATMGRLLKWLREETARYRSVGAPRGGGVMGGSRADYTAQAGAVLAELLRDNPKDHEVWNITTGCLRALLKGDLLRKVER